MALIYETRFHQLLCLKHWEEHPNLLGREPEPLAQEVRMFLQERLAQSKAKNPFHFTRHKGEAPMSTWTRPPDLQSSALISVAHYNTFGIEIQGEAYPHGAGWDLLRNYQGMLDEMKSMLESSRDTPHPDIDERDRFRRDYDWLYWPAEDGTWMVEHLRSGAVATMNQWLRASPWRDAGYDPKGDPTPPEGAIVKRPHDPLLD